MKRGVAFLLLILIIPLIKGVSITEVELNPSGSDAGNEWIEFYSEDEIDLEDYIIKNADSDEFDLNGKFSGYFVLILEKQWLDNADEKVLLYKENDLIHETDLLEDSKNDNYTWSKCKEWEFVKNTKGKENNCDELENEKNSNEDNKIENNEDENLERENNWNNKLKKVADSEQVHELQNNENKQIITLTPQTIKSAENFDEKENKDKTRYAVYGFILFCVTLLFLFILRKLNYARKSGIA